ncbi:MULTISPECIES: hypothetical protein [Haloferax]|uniref:Uncharacterized protein n=2 Tax=Haloferax TaxID=2251 RepID=A0A6G1Z194_9EURY|nr:MULTISPECIES: hypothetical protein [Haloferax]KAB1187509.1 hypothetical protein Hfx1149_05475 [Haloferax sp. CBA1149]MRW80161.1 hypothetical protein [Haloferax marinisediminis]
MALTPEQQKVEVAIRAICEDNKFATVEDITNRVPLSRQTVLDNVDIVVAEHNYIQSQHVGKAKVYYVTEFKLEPIRTSDTDAVIRLESETDADYAEVRTAPKYSEFDFEVHWYDYQLNEIENHVPTDAELGQVVGRYATKPVTIKFYAK